MAGQAEVGTFIEKLRRCRVVDFVARSAISLLRGMNVVAIVVQLLMRKVAGATGFDSVLTGQACGIPDILDGRIPNMLLTSRVAARALQRDRRRFDFGAKNVRTLGEGSIIPVMTSQTVCAWY